MTEQEWLTSTDPEAMVRFVGGVTSTSGIDYSDAIDVDRYKKLTSDRKLRLFACACRNKLLPGPPSDIWRQGELNPLWDSPHAPISDALLFVRNRSGLFGAIDPAKAAAVARDIFGNPFINEGFTDNWMCPWLSSDVVSIARCVYDTEDWEVMPILADALEDAGCSDEAVLRHLRGWEPCPVNYGKGHHKAEGNVSPSTSTWVCETCKGEEWVPLRGPHVRGCWVLDLLLGKD